MLVIIDLCYAGEIAGEFLRFQADPKPGWLGLASATKNQEASVGALTQVIGEFLDSLLKPEDQSYGKQRYLDAAEFIVALQKGLERFNQSLTLLHPRLASLGQSPCLPNPH